MKVLIFGGSGMLGHKLVQVLQLKFSVYATFRTNFADFLNSGIFNPEKVISDVDIEDFDALRQVFDKLKPDVVINAVGVIKQLPTSKDVIKTLKINSIFPHQLARLSQEFNFRLMTVGTDCVFNGQKGDGCFRRRRFIRQKQEFGGNLRSELSDFENFNYRARAANRAQSGRMVFEQSRRQSQRFYRSRFFRFPDCRACRYNLGCD